MKDAWMVIQTLFWTIHWLPVLAVTALSLAVVTLWHLPVFFGRVREKEVDPAAGERRVNKWVALPVTAVLHLVAFANVSIVVTGQGWRSGLLTAGLVSLVWIVPALAVTYLYAGRSLRRAAADSGLYVVLFALAGTILGKW